MIPFPPFFLLEASISSSSTSLRLRRADNALTSKSVTWDEEDRAMVPVVPIRRCPLSRGDTWHSVKENKNKRKDGNKEVVCVGDC